MSGKIRRPSKRTAQQNSANVMDALARGLTYEQAAREAGRRSRRRPVTWLIRRSVRGCGAGMGTRWTT